MHVFREPYNYAAQDEAAVEWQPQPLWAFDLTPVTFELKTYPVTIGVYPTIPLTKAALGITTYPVQLIYNVVAASKASLQITTYPVQIDVATVFETGTASLQITPYAVTIARPKDVSAGPAHLRITPHAASIVLTYNMDVDLAKAALAITAYPVSIYRVVTLDKVELQVTPYTVSFRLINAGITLYPDDPVLSLRPDAPTLTLNS
jgi:hypothetical protein